MKFASYSVFNILMGVRRGEQGGTNALPGFGHLVKHLVKILICCVKILTFGQNTNICPPPKKILLSPKKLLHVDAHEYILANGLKHGRAQREESPDRSKRCLSAKIEGFW